MGWPDERTIDEAGKKLPCCIISHGIEAGRKPAATVYILYVLIMID